MEIRCLLDIRQEILNRPTIRNNLLSVYESIKKLHVGETWTLVSPTDLSLFVREYGFYMKASEFTDTYQVERYHWRPDSPEPAIPTRYVYLAVDKDDTTIEGQNLIDWCNRYIKDSKNDDMRKMDSYNNVNIFQIHRSNETEREISQKVWLESN